MFKKKKREKEITHEIDKIKSKKRRIKSGGAH